MGRSLLKTNSITLTNKLNNFSQKTKNKKRKKKRTQYHHLSNLNNFLSVRLQFLLSHQDHPDRKYKSRCLQIFQIKK